MNFDANQDIRERNALIEEIKAVYYEVFESEMDEFDQLSLEELKDMLIELNTKQPIVENIKILVGRDDDLDYTNLNELTVEGLLELEERLEDDIRYEN